MLIKITQQDLKSDCPVDVAIRRAAKLNFHLFNIPVNNFTITQPLVNYIYRPDKPCTFEIDFQNQIAGINFQKVK